MHNIVALFNFYKLQIKDTTLCCIFWSSSLAASPVKSSYSLDLCLVLHSNFMKFKFQLILCMYTNIKGGTNNTLTILKHIATCLSSAKSDQTTTYWFQFVEGHCYQRSLQYMRYSKEMKLHTEQKSSSNTMHSFNHFFHKFRICANANI